MDILSTDMNTMLNSVSSWWGTGQSKAADAEETSKPKTDTDSDTKPAEVTPSPDTTPAAENTPVTDTPTDTPPTESNPDESKSKDETPAEKKTGPTDIDIEEMSAKAVTTAKEWGSYLFTFGKSATIQVTDQVTKTAKQIKETIDEKTMIGDFNKIQNEFVEERHEKKKKSEAAVPPWVGYNEEEAMKSQILALSSDRRNFLRNPPAGVQFNFDFEGSYPVAMAMLQEDPDLKKMRFDLVPKQVKEVVFWRNYFYRVSLIKQSAQLTSLAQQTGSSTDAPPRASPARTEDLSKESKKSGKAKEDEKDGEEFNPGSPTEHEFISDAFQENQIIEDDFKKELQQLGMTDKEEDIPEWEKELQAELQEYEVVNDGNGLDDDDDLEQEILDQLEAESNGDDTTSKE